MTPIPRSPEAPATDPSLSVRDWDELPGPFSWPLVGNALQLDVATLHLNFEQWVREFGPLFKVKIGARRLLVIADPAVIGDLLKQRPHGFQRPARLHELLSEMGLPTGLFNAEGADWERQRRMVMAAFSPGNVRRYFPALRRVAERMRRRWEQAADAGLAIDLQSDLMRFTVDAIAGLAFGADIDTIGANDDIIQTHLDRIFPALHRRLNTLVPWWRVLPSRADRELVHSVHEVNQAIAGFIAQARQRLSHEPSRRLSPDNLLEAMIVAADETGSGLSDVDVAGNVVTMLLAGEDTTANTLSWLIHLLHRHPEALARAQRDVRQRLADIGQVTPEGLAELDFLDACAHETMRLKPVAPFQALELLHDRTVAGVRMAAGSLLIMPMRSATTDPAHFANPLRFVPERWLDTLEGQGGGPLNTRRVSMPFGAGPRVCPGRYLALLEMKLLMAMLLCHFDLVSVDTPDGQEARERLNFTLTPVGLTLRLKRRAA